MYSNVGVLTEGEFVRLVGTSPKDCGVFEQLKNEDGWMGSAGRSTPSDGVPAHLDLEKAQEVPDHLHLVGEGGKIDLAYKEGCTVIFNDNPDVCWEGNQLKRCLASGR